MFFDVLTLENIMLEQGVEEDNKKWRQMVTTDESWDEQEKGELYTLQIAADSLKAARAEGVLKGLREAAFICEGHAARLAEGHDHHAEFDTVNTCFDLIEQCIREKVGRR